MKLSHLSQVPAGVTLDQPKSRLYSSGLCCGRLSNSGPVNPPPFTMRGCLSSCREPSPPPQLRHSGCLALSDGAWGKWCLQAAEPQDDPQLPPHPPAALGLPNREEAGARLQEGDRPLGGH